MAAARVEGVPVLVAPATAIGFSPHHLSLTGTLSHRLGTYQTMLSETALTILDHGFPRALFVNGHGGNSAPLAALCGELVTDGYPVGLVDYFAPGIQDWVPMLNGSFKGVGHACEYETALMLALGDEDAAARIAKKAADLPPRLTQPWIPRETNHDPITANGARWPAIFQADDCGYYGDPAAATAETGRRMLEATVGGLARFIGEFAATPLRVGIAPDPGAPRIDRLR
jgi:creatinine amidohydrolase